MADIGTLPTTMNFQGTYQAYEKGKQKKDIAIKADYDGRELDLVVKDHVTKNNTHLQMTNDELFDFFSHKQSSKNLMEKLTHNINKNKNKIKIKNMNKDNKQKQQTRKKVVKPKRIENSKNSKNSKKTKKVKRTRKRK